MNEELSMAYFGCPYNSLSSKQKAMLSQQVPAIAQHAGIKVECGAGARESVFGVYAHGQLEDLMGFDLVQLPGWNGECGIFLCEYEGYDCALYVWSKEEKPLHEGGTVMYYRGLVVLVSDETAIAYAKKCYDEKPTAL